MKFRKLLLIALCLSGAIGARVDEQVICQLGARLTEALPEPLRLTPQTVGGVRYLVGTCETTLRTKFNRDIHTTLQHFYKALMYYGTQELQRSLPPSVAAVERENLTNVIWQLFAYRSGEKYTDGKTDKTPFRAPLAKALLVLGEVEVHNNPTSSDMRKALNEIRNELEQVFRSEKQRLEQQDTVPTEDVNELINLFTTYLRQFQESWLNPAFLWRWTKIGGGTIFALEALRLLYKLNNLVSDGSNAVRAAHVTVARAHEGMDHLRDELREIKQKLILPIQHRLDNGLGEGLTEENRGQLLRLFDTWKRVGSMIEDKAPGAFDAIKARASAKSMLWSALTPGATAVAAPPMPNTPDAPPPPDTRGFVARVLGRGNAEGTGVGEE